MNVIEQIKKNRPIRNYKNRRIPLRLIDKIIEAGLWGPSIHGFQPWRFLVIQEKDVIKKIAELCTVKSKEIGIGAGPILSFTAGNLKKAAVLILVYNTQDFSIKASRLKNSYVDIARVSEIQAIGAAVQNMELTATELGIGTCWLTSPLFCSSEINQIVGSDNELVCVLSLGYPNEQRARSKRKQKTDTLSYYSDAAKL